MATTIYLYCACVGYLLTVLYHCGPNGIAGSEFLRSLAPFDVCVIKFSLISRLFVLALIIAPANAVIYGIGGAIVERFAKRAVDALAAKPPTDLAD
jgi:hypothetical protein